MNGEWYVSTIFSIQIKELHHNPHLHKKKYPFFYALSLHNSYAFSFGFWTSTILQLLYHNYIGLDFTVVVIIHDLVGLPFYFSYPKRAKLDLNSANWKKVYSKIWCSNIMLQYNNYMECKLPDSLASHKLTVLAL